MNPEQSARQLIDGKLTQAGWLVQDRKDFKRFAGVGVACREFLMEDGTEADYLLFVDGKAMGVIEAKKAGLALSGIESQSKGYSCRLPAYVKHYQLPLPYIYESNGSEIFFTDIRDPHPAARPIFHFHQPVTLKESLEKGSSLRRRLQNLPVLPKGNLRDCQFDAIRNLEKSLALGKPRSLIQLATGAGKTYTACNFTYRLLKYAKAKRVLFLVDRNNLGRQTYKEFQAFRPDDDNRLFTSLHLVQHLKSNIINPDTEVVITTIQRLYSILRGETDFNEDNEDVSAYESPALANVQVSYNPQIPPEFFDFIITDECHRSIYGLWRQVLEYFDSFLIGLTATPSKQTLGYFNQNLVAEYPYERSVADNVNVGYDIFRVKTEISDKGSRVEAGYTIPKIDRKTRHKIYETLDEDLEYKPEQLDRSVTAINQIRTVLEAYKQNIFTTLFPEREPTWIPKTLIFAKDDNHAENIVRLVREVFNADNDFCKKITYNVSGVKPEDLIQEFRISPAFRIAVTVDMIATGTDIKPLEVLIFMRDVHSELYYEQMKGRGVRTIPVSDLKSVTPNAVCKSKFILIDAVGVTESKKSVQPPLERKKGISFKKLLEQLGQGRCDEDALSSAAARLAALGNALDEEKQAQIKEICGKSLQELSNVLLDAIDPDKLEGKTGAEIEQLRDDAVRPFANPKVRDFLLTQARNVYMYVDDISTDKVIEFAPVKERAEGIIKSLKEFIELHKDELAALSIIYHKSYGKKQLTYDGIKELADALVNNAPSLSIPVLWGAFMQINPSNVQRAKTPEKMLTNVIQLMRFALGQDAELKQFDTVAAQRYNLWLGRQKKRGIVFSADQLGWLEEIKNFIIYNSSMTEKDVQETLSDKGGLLKARQVFAPVLPLPLLLTDLNNALIGANGEE
ncbi:DEAD/DEAH box helicase family protein [Candidatus Proelusimicrobium excrementi]|uniref:type I restriction endonuclease subunit R n=1 Tax=Candidatus Proelusimicrobium excrementi TaxID=3416222 RepID=UPI003CB86C99|nr:DEAD/DEAH box helicase family protein [Elusimicrobiaceae bacterium]